LNDISVFAWDARGHGRSGGERGAARHFMDFIRDADTFVRHLATVYDIPLENMALLGHSVGSVIAATWLHDYATPVRGAVLGSPAFNVKLYVPFALQGLKLLQRVRPDAYVNSYVRPGMLTHDREEAEARRHDPLISPRIGVRVLTSLFETAERIIQGAGSITVPVLLLSAGSDWVVRRKAQQTFFANLGSTRKEMKVLPGFFHEIFHEQERAIPIAQAKVFIEDLFRQPPHESTVPDDGFNRERFVRLNQPLSWRNPKKYGYGLTRLAMQTLGRLSQGIRLGWQAGFDSGRMLDYVYQNQPQGLTALGRGFDRQFLNSPGWQGIRQRGQHLQELLTATIRDCPQPVHIVDVAAGPGGYILDTLADFPDQPVTALCRDWDEAALNEGRKAAAARNITPVQFEQGDAFDPASLAQLQPQPNIVVVSGLYELFADNALILQSLRGIYDALQAGGYLIYTNQPHHPQLEFIARTLTNRDGEAWIMRPRPQAEMNALVRAVGFEPQTLRIDDAGIFTVSVARKRS
jgi:alpha-beta hydrolase superfamily lysophospholipase/SAM-dependent methyltransferase